MGILKGFNPLSGVFEGQRPSKAPFSKQLVSIAEFVIKDKADDKVVMWISRITVLVIALAGIVIAWDKDSVIFGIVSFARAGLGATFGPLMLFSLFWKRVTKQGAIAGMLTGGISVFLWEFVFTKFFAEKVAFFGIYELLPAFVLSSIVIVVVSLLTKEPDGEIIEEFERAKRGEIEEAPVEA